MTPPPDKPILYAKAGQHPDWRKLQVVHAKNGRLIPDVLEANAHEGWYVQAVREKGELRRNAQGQLATRRVHGAIKIQPKG